MSNQIYKGSWEEVSAHAAEFAGKQVQVIVLDMAPEDQANQNGELSPAEIERRMSELEAYFATISDFPQQPLLSDADISRESLYGKR